MIKRELTTRLKSLFFWAVGFSFIIIGGMTEFDAFSSGNSEQLNEFIRSMPRIMRVIYGIENVDISSFEGYFSLLMLYVLIMLAIHGAFLGTSLIHREIKGRTADFLFVKPMSRDRILLRKLLGGLGIILILETAISVCYLSVFSQTGNLELFPETLLATFATHFFFFALGFLLAILFPKTKHGQQTSLVFILVSYFSISLSQLYNQPWLLNISPIGWYSSHLFKSSPLEISFTLIFLLLLSSLFLGLAIYRFRSKDIPS